MASKTSKGNSQGHHSSSYRSNHQVYQTVDKLSFIVSKYYYIMKGYLNALHGHYYPTHPEKVISKDNLLPAFKSRLEYLMMRYCDITDAVVKWAYEPAFAIIPYFDKAHNKNRHYIVDFVLWVKGPKDSYRQIWIEIKPYEQTIPPKKTARVTESTVDAWQTYITNQCKWKAARKFCNSHGIDFLVITENEL